MRLICSQIVAKLHVYQAIASGSLAQCLFTPCCMNMRVVASCVSVVKIRCRVRPSKRNTNGDKHTLCTVYTIHCKALGLFLFFWGGAVNNSHHLTISNQPVSIMKRQSNISNDWRPSDNHLSQMSSIS